MKVWKGPWIITDLIHQSFGPKPPWKWSCHLALPVDSSFPERLGKMYLIKRGYLLWFTIIDNHEGGLIVSWEAACDAMVGCPKKKKKGAGKKVENESHGCLLNESHQWIEWVPRQNQPEASQLQPAVVIVFILSHNTSQQKTSHGENEKWVPRTAEFWDSPLTPSPNKNQSFHWRQMP